MTRTAMVRSSLSKLRAAAADSCFKTSWPAVVKRSMGDALVANVVVAVLEAIAVDGMFVDIGVLAAEEMVAVLEKDELLCGLLGG